jgi:hypothetical protein
MRQSDAKYDMIVLEPLQSWTAGTTNLYTREFYEEAQRLLNPGGVVAQWIPFYGQASEETRSMVGTGLDVFANATLWLVQNDGVIVYSDTMPSLAPEILDRRIRERGIASTLEKFPARSAEDLLHYLQLGTKGLRAWTEGAEIIVDDRPFLEFRAARAIGSPNKFFSILDSLRPFLDNIADYTPGASTADKKVIRRVDQIRQASVALRSVAQDQHEKRVRLLEAIEPDATLSMQWQRLYHQEIMAWAVAVRAQDEAAARAILVRGKNRAQQGSGGE